MARSSRKTASRTTTATRTAPIAAQVVVPTRVREIPVRAARSIKNYTFEYQRDQVSRQAGSSYFRLESNASNGEVIEMSLQEAKSLYNFLDNALNRS